MSQLQYDNEKLRPLIDMLQQCETSDKVTDYALEDILYFVGYGDHLRLVVREVLLLYVIR